MIVYAFPPSGLTAWEWTVEDPVDTSRSLLTGRRYASQQQRRRRLASLTTIGLTSAGAEWRRLEALKRLLAGGANLVRLTERDESLYRAAQGRGLPLTWASGGEPLTWTDGGAPLAWAYDTTWMATATTLRGQPALSFTGLTASTRFADAGERVAVGGAIATLLDPIVADGAGAAVARIDVALASGPALIGALETGLFEVLDIPRAVRPLAQQFDYQWSFREVFADEIGDYTEIDPW